MQAVINSPGAGLEMCRRLRRLCGAGHGGHLLVEVITSCMLLRGLVFLRRIRLCSPRLGSFQNPGFPGVGSSRRSRFAIPCLQDCMPLHPECKVQRLEVGADRKAAVRGAGHGVLARKSPT